MDGSEGVLGIPFWSPDSRYVAFGTDSKLKKMEAAGGPAQTLTAVAANVVGGLWTLEGKIVFGQFSAGSESGLREWRYGHIHEWGGRSADDNSVGAPGRQTFCVWRQGRGLHCLFGRWFSGDAAAHPSGPYSVAYTPAPSSKQGYLLFVRAVAGPGPGPRTGTLMAQPFDPRRNELAGDATPIAENVRPRAASLFPRREC